MDTASEQRGNAVKPACSIVIRCYNEEEHIGRLLSGIMQQTVTDVEIIVVDSGSTDATVAIAQRYPVRVLTIDQAEFSFGRSLNIGCAAATADYIVMASAHVYPVYRDWLAQMLRPFQNPEVALVYGKQRGDATTQYAEHRVFARWFPDESDFRQRSPFCNNANAAIRRSLWQQTPYDEDLTGLEDLDWARKMVDQGYCLAYNADAEIVHVHDERPRQTYNRYRREALAFKRIYPDASFTLLDAARLWTVNVLNDYRHALRDGVLHRKWFEIARFRLMQFLGTYRGYAQHLPVTRHLRQTFYYPERRRPETRPRARDRLRIQYGAQPGEPSQPAREAGPASAHETGHKEEHETAQTAQTAPEEERGTPLNP